MEEKVYLYIFKDNEGNSEDYTIITKHNCKKLIKDIETYYYDIIDCEDKEELIQTLKEEKVCKELIDFIQKNDFAYDGCYDLELAILIELGELIDCEEETFYY